MKNYAKISKVRNNLRNGSELAKDGMEKVLGGIAIPGTDYYKVCPYIGVKYSCPYINVRYSCPYNNQCKSVSKYSVPVIGEPMDKADISEK